jgi:hypothetical protein
MLKVLISGTGFARAMQTLSAALELKLLVSMLFNRLSGLRHAGRPGLYRRACIAWGGDTG